MHKTPALPEIPEQTVQDSQTVAMLRLTFCNNAVLTAWRMAYLQHQGVFVPSSRQVMLGQRFFVILQVEEAGDTHSTAGLARVCWITPEGSSDGRAPGFGVHFDSSAVALRDAVLRAAEHQSADAGATVNIP